ncbi:iron-siderophore ABC transporter substrate-binding protein [Yoonia sp.]|uniref:iron-siderophore ABC transporter substrate-binding protein n=1 Tax=Yoonia sp. TaxID=2212373 RepID=UPI003F4ACFDC
MIQCLASAALLAAPAFAETYPMTVEHKYGTTTIQEQPLRIATVDYGGADNILAFGFQPVTSRYWFGPAENGLWPWAQDLATTEPETLRGDLDFEHIAATQPDLIIAIRSGITPDEYDQLSRIAPTVAVPDGTGDFELTWDERASIVGGLLGKSDEAATLIAALDERISNIAAAHPDWANHDFAIATYWDGSVGVYTTNDGTSVLINRLGLEFAQGVRSISTDGEFYTNISSERLADLDTDVLFWYADPAPMAQIISLPLYPLLDAPKEGREIILSTESMLNGQLSYASLLSLSGALDALVPAIEAAIDGDPTTPVAFQ